MEFLPKNKDTNSYKTVQIVQKIIQRIIKEYNKRHEVEFLIKLSLELRYGQKEAVTCYLLVFRILKDPLVLQGGRKFKNCNFNF